MRSPWPRSLAGPPTPSDNAEPSGPTAAGYRASSEFLTIPAVTIHAVEESAEQEPNSRRPSLKPSLILTTPRLLSWARPRSSLRPQSVRSPTSVRSVIDPSATLSNSALPMSPITFETRESMHRASARVLDYGGMVSLDSASERNDSQGEMENTLRSAQRRGRRRIRQGHSPRWIPRHSAGKIFFPAMKHPVIRTKVFHCVISGGLLLLVFTVFMALMNAMSEFAQEFRIIMILFMLVLIVLFTHSMIRLLILLLRLRRRGALDNEDTRTGGFAQVRHPIRVVLARDEELGISGTEPRDELKDPAPPPPVYGQWRGSVRVDPNLIHWQRVERSSSRPLSEGTMRRPPSYISENAEEATAEHDEHEAVANETVEREGLPTESLRHDL